MYLLLSTVLVAVGSHLYFKEYEPSPLHFIAGLTLSSGILIAALVAQGIGLLGALLQTSLWTACYVSSLLLSISIYRLCSWHPLASFPGPKLAILSKWYIVRWVVFKGGRHLFLKQAHETYGPWVRVGPNEISVNVADAVRAVYKLDRSPFYQGTPAKADSLINDLSRPRHLQRRQKWAKAVTGATMLSYIPTTQVRVEQLLDIFVRTSVVSGKINLDHWMNLFFLDLMGDMGFSGGFETMKAGHDAEQWLKTLATGVSFTAAMGQVPWFKPLFRFLPEKSPLETFQQFTEQKVKEIRARPETQIQNDILSIVLDHSEKGVELTAAEAAADATLVVVAATDTGVQAVVSFVRYLIVDKARQARLQGEVDTVFDKLTGEVDVNAIFQLPFLDACLQESLRIMPPGPFGPYRYSGSSGTMILDKFVPPKTTLHMPVFTMHRDPTNFGPLAHEFHPERWIDGQENELLRPLNREAFVPFSTGYSSCIGKQLAIQNIKITLAHMFHSFTIQPAPGFDALAFDGSYKEYGLWTHDPLEIVVTPRSAAPFG